MVLKKRKDEGRGREREGKRKREGGKGRNKVSFKIIDAQMIIRGDKNLHAVLC